MARKKVICLADDYFGKDGSFYSLNKDERIQEKNSIILGKTKHYEIGKGDVDKFIVEDKTSYAIFSDEKCAKEHFDKSVKAYQLLRPDVKSDW